MPTSKQARKRMRQNERRRAANKTARTAMRSAIKKVLQAETAEGAQKAVPEAMKRIDKAAKKSVIHANAAARYKNRLARRIAAK
ncbi:MAG: 30S ribosomal protein S20 [Planctomycetota bacterium]